MNRAGKLVYFTISSSPVRGLTQAAVTAEVSSAVVQAGNELLFTVVNESIINNVWAIVVNSLRT
jgi:hypothetical protein